MRLIPARSGLRHKVCEAIYLHGPMTIDKAQQFVRGVSTDSLRSAFWGCAEQGYCEVKDGFVYHLSRAVKKHFDDIFPNQEKPEIVQPRKINVFASNGLSKKYQINPLGIREGSNDHLNYRSKHI